MFTNSIQGALVSCVSDLCHPSFSAAWKQHPDLDKKWEFGQKKKNLIYQFFKIRISVFMTYGQFPPKSSSNLRFVIRDSRVRGPRLCHRKGLKPLISDDKSQIWATFWRKLTIGHKSTYSSFEKLIKKFFFSFDQILTFWPSGLFWPQFPASPRKHIFKR